MFVPVAAIAAPIVSGGPLTNIDISADLNCAVDHVGDTAPEWYGTTACATLVATGGTLYGPANIPAGGSASPRTTWVPVSQSAVTGSGTSAVPYTVVTVVAAAATGLTLTQTDRYVVGDESYRTTIVLSNAGASDASGVLYRAGDCYLQDSDFGFGAVDASSGAVTCTASDQAGARIEQMLPLTAGSRYIEDHYGTVWAAVGSQQPLPNTCLCGSNIDNGIALSWSFTLAAGASAAYSSLITFSPLGHQPVTIAKTADVASVPAGSADGYTITVTNPNAEAVTLASLSDTLPPGFAYTAGSSSGVTTTNPQVAGSVLTWSGLVVPGAGTASLHFGVTVASQPGTYTNAVSGESTNYTVVPTGPTAPVTVTAIVPVNRAPVATDVSATTPQDTPVGVTLVATDPDGDALTYAVVSGPSHGLLSGTGASLTYTPTAGYSGPDSFTFRANDGALNSNTATAALTVMPVTPPACSTAPTIDAVVSADTMHASSKLVSPRITTGAQRLLLAFIGADGPRAPTQRVTGVTGGGLTWTLAVRSNSTWGTTEVWQAWADSGVSGAKVTAKLAKSGFDGSITVAAFAGAASQVGATASTGGTLGAAEATLSSGCGSLVWAAGHDWTWDRPIGTPPSQGFVHAFNDTRVHDSFWVQSLNSPTVVAGPTTLTTTGFLFDRWTLAAVEVRPAD